jgi:hypothetical protein
MGLFYLYHYLSIEIPSGGRETIRYTSSDLYRIVACTGIGNKVPRKIEREKTPVRPNL